MSAVFSSPNTIYKYRRAACYYMSQAYLSRCPYERLYYENLLMFVMNRLMESTIMYRGHLENGACICSRQAQKFTHEELKEYDGTGEKPAYVAVNGIVYDVSLAGAWGGATHFGLAAGEDLSAQFNDCHDENAEVLASIPRVGILVQSGREG